MFGTRIADLASAGESRVKADIFSIHSVLKIDKQLLFDPDHFTDDRV